MKEHSNLIYVAYIDSNEKINLIEHNFNQLRPYFNKAIIVYSCVGDFSISEGFCGLNSDEIFLISNVDFDFGKYKYGLSKLQDDSTEYTTLVNDSVSLIQSPQVPMGKLNDLMDQGYEYIGMVASHEQRLHYQSWFLTFNKRAVSYFCNKLTNNLREKIHHVNYNEVNLSNQMIEQFKSSGLYEYHANIFYHLSVEHKQAIAEGFPFIKNNYFDDHFAATTGHWGRPLCNGLWPNIDPQVIEMIKDTYSPVNDIAILLQLYHVDLWDYFKQHLERLRTKFDLYVQLYDDTEDVSDDILKIFPKAKITYFPNKGQDIGPFIKTLKTIRNKNHKYIIKLHSKKCQYDINLGNSWRDELVKALIPNDDKIESNIRAMQKNNVKMCGCKKWKHGTFFGGTMFMADFKAILSCLSNETIDDWYKQMPKGYVRDNSFTHRVERMLGMRMIKAGYTLAGVSWVPEVHSENHVISFYEPIETPNEFSTQSADLLPRWRKNWRERGWEPRVLDLTYVKNNKHVNHIDLDSDSALYIGRNGKNYLKRCYAKWLAYCGYVLENGASMWSDYDIYNRTLDFSKFQQEVKPVIQNKFGDVSCLIDGAGAAGLMSKERASALIQLIERFSRAKGYDDVVLDDDQLKSRFDKHFNSGIEEFSDMYVVRIFFDTAHHYISTALMHHPDPNRPRHSFEKILRDNHLFHLHGGVSVNNRELVVFEFPENGNLTRSQLWDYFVQISNK